jgi:hypothetical protein
MTTPKLCTRYALSCYIDYHVGLLSFGMYMLLQKLTTTTSNGPGDDEVTFDWRFGDGSAELKEE